jgi:F420-dependent oxidoreductase-like protein
MRIAMQMSYGGEFDKAAEQLADFESAGLDAVFVGEAYSFDAVSQLGYLAARTKNVGLYSGILNVYSRTPALLAMTAAALDYLSGGRFTLGIGASGPQVVEGFHGVPYAAPLATTREVAEICRSVWRRELLEHEGERFRIPLGREDGGTGLGKPLKLINRPVRDRVPMVLAAMGPKNVELAAELFEAWEPLFFLPEAKNAAFGHALTAGTARRDPALGPLQVIADTQLLITDDPAAEERALTRVRDHLALYAGGMGAKGRNFYNDLAARFGFQREAATVQELYLAGRKKEAAAALPDELVRGVCLVGSRARVADRIQAFADSGVWMVNAQMLGEDHTAQLRSVEILKELVV